MSRQAMCLLLFLLPRRPLRTAACCTSAMLNAVGRLAAQVHSASHHEADVDEFHECMPVELTCQACKLQIAENKLTIKGKLPGRTASDAEEVIGERHAFTSFDRTFRLWDDIDASKITAKLVTARTFSLVLISAHICFSCCATLSCMHAVPAVLWSRLASAMHLIRELQLPYLHRSMVCCGLSCHARRAPNRRRFLSTRATTSMWQ